MSFSFLKKLELFPPVRCRLVAVHRPNGGCKWPVPFSAEQINQNSELQLGLAKVRYLSQLTDWDEVKFGDIKLFLKGCRLNFGNWGAFGRISRMSARGKFFYLRRDPLWETEFKELVEILEKYERGKK